MYKIYISEMRDIYILTEGEASDYFVINLLKKKLDKSNFFSCIHRLI